MRDNQKGLVCFGFAYLQQSITSGCSVHVFDRTILDILRSSLDNVKQESINFESYSKVTYVGSIFFKLGHILGAMNSVRVFLFGEGGGS